MFSIYIYICIYVHIYIYVWFSGIDGLANKESLNLLEHYYYCDDNDDGYDAVFILA